MIAIISLLIALLVVGTKADYYKVQSETCQELSTPSYFFDSFLLPCAKYRSPFISQTSLKFLCDLIPLLLSF